MHSSRIINIFQYIGLDASVTTKIDESAATHWSNLKVDANCEFLQFQTACKSVDNVNKFTDNNWW